MQGLFIRFANENTCNIFEVNYTFDVDSLKICKCVQCTRVLVCDFKSITLSHLLFFCRCNRNSTPPYRCFQAIHFNLIHHPNIHRLRLDMEGRRDSSVSHHLTDSASHRQHLYLQAPSDPIRSVPITPHAMLHLNMPRNIFHIPIGHEFRMGWYLAVCISRKFCPWIIFRASTPIFSLEISSSVTNILIIVGIMVSRLSSSSLSDTPSSSSKKTFFSRLLRI